MKKTKKESDILRRYRQCKADTQRLRLETILTSTTLLNLMNKTTVNKQKCFWSYIKSLRKDNIGILPLKDKGRLFNAPVDKANILNCQYQSTFTQENTDHVPSPTGPPYPDKEEIQVEKEGIRKQLQNADPWKATGLDCIPA